MLCPSVALIDTREQLQRACSARRPMSVMPYSGRKSKTELFRANGLTVSSANRQSCLSTGVCDFETASGNDEVPMVPSTDQHSATVGGVDERCINVGQQHREICGVDRR